MTQIDEVNLCIVNAFVEIRKIIRDDYRMVIYDLGRQWKERWGNPVLKLKS